MPIFDVTDGKAVAIGQTNFNNEKELQTLVEKNMETFFNCRFVASEFPTGPQHAGRIDTLGLSEDENPVIIEYKKVESSDLINQSLFYLSWIQDHKGDFEITAQKTLSPKVMVDWSDIRVICIAPNYRKYDLHAVKVMGANIELWRYRMYDNSTIHFEEIFRQSLPEATSSGKNPVMIAAGKKAAKTRANAHYTLEEHLQGRTKAISELTLAIHDYILGLDSSIEATPKKFYIAYKVSQNIVCMEVRKKNILLFLKLPPADVKPAPDNYRNVLKIGHYGTGDVEISVKTETQFEKAKRFIEMAYNKVGG